MRVTKFSLVYLGLLLLSEWSSAWAQTPATGSEAAGGAPAAGAPTAPVPATGGNTGGAVTPGGAVPAQGQPTATPANPNAAPSSPNANANPSNTNASPTNPNASPGNNAAFGNANAPGVAPNGSGGMNNNNQANGVNNPANTTNSASANTGGPFGNGRSFAQSNHAGFSIQAGGTGLRVDRLLSGGIAATGGVRVGDQVVSVNGQPVTSEAQLFTQLQNGSRESQVLLGVQRDGKFQMVPLRSNAMGASTSGNAGMSSFGEGATFATASTSGTANGQVNGQDGMLVSHVTPGSWAAGAGLQANDRVTSINGQPLDNQFGFAAQLQVAMGTNGAAELMVNRNGQMVPIRITSSSQPSGQSGQAALTGNFSTDFDHWAGDFGTAAKQAQQNYQSQLSRLSQFNDRVTSLRANVMSSTGQSFDRQRLMDQWRTLQTDLDSLSAGSHGDFQVQLNLLRNRMNEMNPSGSAAATTSGTASGTAAASGSPTPSASAGGSGTTSNSTPNTNTNPSAVPQ